MSSTTIRTNLQKITCKNITLDLAKQAVKAYNEGIEGCIKNPHVDEEAGRMFRHGLGSTVEEIEHQLRFIGDRKHYGGVAGFPAALSLAGAIAVDIYNCRTEYEQAAVSAVPLLREVPKRTALKILYRPFIKPFQTRRGPKCNWLVWASKFWHFLNHDAFPMKDSRVCKFYGVDDSALDPVDNYLTLCVRVRAFALSHKEWLPELWAVDGYDACCELKLWDKMCYGAEDLNRTRA